MERALSQHEGWEKYRSTGQIYARKKFLKFARKVFDGERERMKEGKKK